MLLKASAKILAITCIGLLAQNALSQNLKIRLHCNRISDRDLLGIGEPATRITTLFKDNLSDNPADTLRILAIRVEFQEDNNGLTTGIGKFDLSVPEGLVIDPPPHDLTYFEHQLLALSNYFKTVSGGKLILQAEVYPKVPSASYTVSQEMSFYSPLQPEELLDQRLAELFQESFQLADENDSIDFSQFDSFILFHAGVGLDFALDFDATPQDIPSVFLDFATLQEQLGNHDPTYAGISVNGGRFFIRDGIILPETQSQEGFEVALLGTMAIMFGNQLGLPVLFNPDTGRSGIGVFGLMDQGSGNFFGLLPAEPCAWSKIFLGWENAIEVRNGESLPVAASLASEKNKIYKIPIDTQEYFLIENRHRDFNDDGMAIGSDANGTRVEYKWDEQGQRILAAQAIGVITQVNEYDFGLPGSGILIWHIDERVIASNFAENRVNADPERRGIDLEEADGAQDIGRVYGFLDPGVGSETGVIEDMFWGSNEINMLVNGSAPDVAFTPFTTPSSLSNSGANSHIFLTGFSEPAEVMAFSVREDISVGGFPQLTSGSAPFANSPIIADLDGDRNQELIYSAPGGDIYVWNANGTKFIANSDSISVNGSFGAKKLPLAIFAQPKGSKGFSPAIASFNDQKVIIAVTDLVVAAYMPIDSDLNGRAETLFVSEASAEFTTDPLVVELISESAGFRVVVGTSEGQVLGFNSQGIGTEIGNVSRDAVVGLAALPEARIAYGTSVGEIGLLSLAGDFIWQNKIGSAMSKAPVVGDLNNDGKLNIIAISDLGQIFVFDEDGETLTGFPMFTNTNSSSQLALGDIDGDHFFEIVLVSKHSVFAFSHVGVLESGFPIQMSLNNDEGEGASLVASPILVDIDDDGQPEILVGSDANKLEAYHVTGERVQDFPLSVGHSVRSTATVGDLDNDGDIEIVVGADDGFLYVWDLPGKLEPGNIPWGGYLADERHANANLERKTPPPSGGQLMPSNRVYNYPNPTEGNQTTIRYMLNFPAQVHIKIFDLAGELVDELTGPGFGQSDNEVEWQLSRIESGVYLAQVEAEGDGMKDVVVFKIAVVK